MNRVAVDSLYRESGNLSSFTKNEIRTFALILHHSDDCEWNRKWTKIFFSELKSENLKSVPLLGIAVERMFGSQESVCLNREPEVTTHFLDKLRKKYPILYKEYFR